MPGEIGGETVVLEKIRDEHGEAARCEQIGAGEKVAPVHLRAAVAEVPFVDVVTTMSDPSIPLTVTEWEEWGDPREEPMASYMLSYSPYDHTVPADYPAIYITAGLNDPRVSYHEPAKWVAKLRATAEGDQPILLKTDLKAGEDFYLAFSPEREDPGNSSHSVASIPKVVGGLCEKSRDVACALYSAIVPKVVPVSCCTSATATMGRWYSGASSCSDAAGMSASTSPSQPSSMRSRPPSSSPSSAWPGRGTG